MKHPAKHLVAACVAFVLTVGLALAQQVNVYHLGDLTLSSAFARATLPNAPVAGGYMTINNSGDSDDTLLGVSAEFAGRAMLHHMEMQGDVMRMQPIMDGLPIPAGQTVILKPGGDHMMFHDLHTPLMQGQTADVTLRFAKAGEITIPLAIGAPNARAAPASPAPAN